MRRLQHTVPFFGGAPYQDTRLNLGRKPSAPSHATCRPGGENRRGARSRKKNGKRLLGAPGAPLASTGSAALAASRWDCGRRVPVELFDGQQQVRCADEPCKAIAGGAPPRSKTPAARRATSSNTAGNPACLCVAAGWWIGFSARDGTIKTSGRACPGRGNVQRLHVPRPDKPGRSSRQSVRCVRGLTSVC